MSDTGLERAWDTSGLKKSEREREREYKNEIVAMSHDDGS
jgi:hypothetical protein